MKNRTNLEAPAASKAPTVLVFRLITSIILALSLSFSVEPDPMAGQPPTVEKDFNQKVLQGFGDRQNSWTWSMQWWNDLLYVGTNRAWHCAEIASFHLLFPDDVPYPPLDPDIECTADPEDLPLQAEIWRWTPGTDTWERVYQSPQDVALASGKLVARDIGYRGMTVFEEADGTEALYVTGVSPRFIGYDSEASAQLPPRILRSTDGVNFEPLPQDPGTFLGDFPYSSLRSPVGYQGRLYLVGSIVQGSGVLIEAADPTGGNDNFRQVSPQGLVVSTVRPYNGFLYVGVRNMFTGYSIVKTDATGDPPYQYTTIVDQGGYLLGPGRNIEVLNMKEFKERLYIGGNGLGTGSIGSGNAAELIRINPDDSWDLIAGYPRSTPTGDKSPLSGFLAGFDNFFNAHMWRLEVFEDNLYVGTFDTSTSFKENVTAEPFVRDIMGFDLYRTEDGSTFSALTSDGFGDKFNFGVRALSATPFGLFLGTTNYYYGLQVWRGQPIPPPIIYQHYLPIIFSTRSSNTSATDGLPSALPPASPAPTPLLPSSLTPPPYVEAEVIDQGVLVSWEPVAGASQYHIFRAEIQYIPTSVFPEGSFMATSKIKIHIPAPAQEIGATTDLYFADQAADPEKRYLYHVQATAENGVRSAASNIAPASASAPRVTFASLIAELVEIQRQQHIEANLAREFGEKLVLAKLHTQEADYSTALNILASLNTALTAEDQTLMTAWKAADYSSLLRKLERRVQLAQAGLIPGQLIINH